MTLLLKNRLSFLIVALVAVLFSSCGTSKSGGSSESPATNPKGGVKPLASAMGI